MSSQKPQYQPGQIVPGTVYRVHRVIGAGGMGTVYDVEDTTVGKRYVLKTLHANLADRDDLAGRLLREARALARMHHPSIVEVFTAGTTSDHLKLPYYVMEKLNGQSLRQVLARKGRLELDQALDIGIDLLDALDHAHELGMIHRDVKPDNIYLHKAIDGTHVAKLLDFGIAKVVAATTQLTGGRFIGTFRYASPEQIMGGDLTTSSDLYSAGLTLYEMFAGRGPFDDFAGEIEIGKAHASVPAPRLSRFMRVPQRLDDLVASSLEKRPAQRPKDAFKFASVLRELKQEFRQSRVSAPPSQQITAKPVQSDASTAVLISDGTHAAVTPRMDGPQSDKPTRLESPQSHNAPTEMAPSSQDGPKPDSTTSPYGPKVLDPPRSQPHPQMTMRIGQAHTLQDGAPAPMTILPHLSPQPPPVDRSAETNVSGPESVIAAPQHDTVMLPHLVHSPAPPPPPAHEMGGGVSTFGAQTTDASAKPKSSPKALFVALGAFGLVAIVGIAVVLVMHARKTPEVATAITSAVSTTAAPPPATSTAPRITITPTPVETVAPAPTPTPTPTPSPSPTPTLAPTPSPTPTLTLAPTLAPTPTAKPSAKPSATKKDPLHVGSGL